MEYVRELIRNGSLKSLREIAGNQGNKTNNEAGLVGTYTGVWQSQAFAVSGAATMTIRMDGNAVTASIFLTGGEVTSATLTGTAAKSGENVWTAELYSKRPKLYVRAIFRNGTFVGDYRYSRFLMDDRGQWVLKKE